MRRSGCHCSDIPGTDKANHLFRAQEDGYLDLRLSRNPSPLFQAVKKMSDDLLKHRAASNTEILEALYHLKNEILWAFGFEYHRRQYHYLHQVIRQLFTQLDEGTLVHNEEDRLALFQCLNRLRTRFNNQETEVVERRERLKEATEKLKEKVKDMLPELSPALLDGESQQIKELLDATQRQIASLPEVEEQCAFYYRLRTDAKLEVERERDRLDLEAMIARNNPESRSPLEDGYNLLRTAIDQFHERDMIIYPT